MSDAVSLMKSIALLPGSERRRLIDNLSEAEAAALRFHWPSWARPGQLPPGGDWTVWLLLARRGFGKTRVGAEWVRGEVCGATPLGPGRYRRLALVAETAADARDVMVEGESGLLAVHPAEFRPRYEPSKRRISWPNGAIATLYNATEPDQLRGPQHDAAWCDELAKWRHGEATWDMLQFGLRLGERPRQVVTTTPRPLRLLKAILASPDTVTTRGTTHDNRENLAPAFFTRIIQRYEGTRLGRQELDGEILEDVPGALWWRRRIDELRVREAPELRRIVVAIDPAATSREGADESGIIVAGLGADRHGYVLEDLSLRGTPDEVCRAAWHGYVAHAADRVVAEVNNGGEWIGTVLRHLDPAIPYRALRATRGKVTRAEPVAALYEQGRVHHVGAHPTLEDQMCAFTVDFGRGAGGDSPDRVDALVWAFTELMPGPAGQPRGAVI